MATLTLPTSAQQMTEQEIREAVLVAAQGNQKLRMRLFRLGGDPSTEVIYELYTEFCMRKVPPVIRRARGHGVRKADGHNADRHH